MLAIWSLDSDCGYSLKNVYSRINLKLGELLNDFF